MNEKIFFYKIVVNNSSRRLRKFSSKYPQKEWQWALSRIFCLFNSQISFMQEHYLGNGGTYFKQTRSLQTVNLDLFTPRPNHTKICCETPFSKKLYHLETIHMTQAFTIRYFCYVKNTKNHHLKRSDERLHWN